MHWLDVGFRAATYYVWHVVVVICCTHALYLDVSLQNSCSPCVQQPILFVDALKNKSFCFAFIYSNIPDISRNVICFNCPTVLLADIFMV